VFQATPRATNDLGLRPVSLPSILMIRLLLVSTQRALEDWSKLITCFLWETFERAQEAKCQRRPRFDVGPLQADGNNRAGYLLFAKRVSFGSFTSRLTNRVMQFALRYSF
jgi:hypothetical protein